MPGQGERAQWSLDAYATAHGSLIVRSVSSWVGPAPDPRADGPRGDQARVRYRVAVTNTNVPDGTRWTA